MRLHERLTPLDNVPWYWRWLPLTRTEGSGGIHALEYYWIPSYYHDRYVEVPFMPWRRHCGSHYKALYGFFHWSLS